MVHGTFAHFHEAPVRDGVEPADLYWWKKDSGFTRHMADLVSGQGGDVSFETFIWSGENSERERRQAGSRLLSLLQELEKKSEPYCVIGHSHGGSVIASALIESVARGVDLSHLQRWMSVGTPFVHLRKERFLFLRLPLFLKAIFVASLMLLMMFLFFVGGELAYGQSLYRNSTELTRLAISAGLTTLPFLLFYLYGEITDSRRLWFYRRKTIEKARELYAPKWLSFVHEDDEAVQGLGSLSSVKLNIFGRSFAVPGLSLASVYVLPLLYIYLILSPTLMTNLAGFLGNNIYGLSDFRKVEASYKTQRRKINDLRKQISKIEKQMRHVSIDTAKRMEQRAAIDNLQRVLRAQRKAMRKAYPSITQTQRAARFKKRFFEIDGRPCPGDRLCHGGRNIALNSGLLFHLVTDECASWFVDKEVRFGAFGRYLRYLVPIILVPIVFGVLAVAMVMLVQFLAGYISYLMSFMLDDLTWSEVRRSALGNDTEAEVAIAARRRPAWIEKSRPFLPTALADKITQHSNKAMIASLGKIRGAISDLAFADGSEDKTATVLAFINWQELIHMAYFEVPEFRALVAVAISELDGFQPRDVLQNDPHRANVEGWLNALRHAATKGSG